MSKLSIAVLDYDCLNPTSDKLSAGNETESNGRARIVNDEKMATLLGQLKSSYPQNVWIELQSMPHHKSVNIGPAEWTTISKDVHSALESNDAVVVTIDHTDTLPYLAGAAALALGPGLKKPVIFTTPQHLAEGRSIRSNIIHSLDAAIEANKQGVAEVMVCNDQFVFRGARLLQVKTEDRGKFDSPSFPIIGKCGVDSVTFYSNAREVQNASPVFRLENKFADNIAMLEVGIASRPEVLASLGKMADVPAIILRTNFGNDIGLDGTRHTLPSAFRPVVEKLVAEGKPIIICTNFQGGPGPCKSNYAPFQTYGAVHAGDMTDVMALAKISWLIGQGVTDLNTLGQRMVQNEIGEIAIDRSNVRLEGLPREVAQTHGYEPDPRIQTR